MQINNKFKKKVTRIRFVQISQNKCLWYNFTPPYTATHRSNYGYPRRKCAEPTTSWSLPQVLTPGRDRQTGVGETVLIYTSSYGLAIVE